MSTSHRVAARARSVALYLSAMLLGAALVAPVSAQVTGSGVQPQGTIYTRTASCHGLDFHPIDSSTDYSYSGPLLYRVLSAGTGYFLCDPGLPNRAVVTKVAFLVNDVGDEVEVRYCALYRAGLTPATAEPSELMAAVPSTGMAATPGTVRLATTAITNATVNNNAYGYWLQCQIFLLSPNALAIAGIYGAVVTYTISSTNG